MKRLLCILCVSAVLTSCGYHVGGQAAKLPTNAKVIAVPAFRNETSSFKAEQVLTQAIVHEFLARTGYRVQPETAGSDAVLTGTVIQYWTTPIVVEPTVGRAISVNVNMRMRVKLTDNHTGKVIWQNPEYNFNETYEISGDASTYFEESSPAVQRLARRFAAGVVSTILEAW